MIPKGQTIEGRDYTLRNDGAWIFTREYLLSRGTCCQSICLNCPYEHSKENLKIESMRPVISMVPSWTETLVHARARVVGRTRFCVHPTDAVKNVSVLGGTKTLAQDADLKMRELVEIAGRQVHEEMRTLRRRARVRNYRRRRCRDGFPASGFSTCARTDRRRARPSATQGRHGRAV